MLRLARWGAVAGLIAMLCASSATAGEGEQPPPEFKLSVAIQGGGSVTGPGIACPPGCTRDYPAGTNVTLTPVSSDQHQFVRFDGACNGETCTLTMNEDKSVSALFAFKAVEPTHTLNVTVVGPGRVTGPGISCPTDCTETFDDSVEVTLTPMPAADAAFEGFSGACSGQTCTITLQAMTTAVTATFAGVSSPTAPEGSPPPGSTQAPDPASPAPAQTPELTLTNSDGEAAATFAPGEVVELRGTGLLADTTYDVIFAQSPGTTIGSGSADGEGTMETTVTIPASATDEPATLTLAPLGVADNDITLPILISADVEEVSAGGSSAWLVLLLVALALFVSGAGIWVVRRRRLRTDIG